MVVIPRMLEHQLLRISETLIMWVTRKNSYAKQENSKADLQRTLGYEEIMWHLRSQALVNYKKKYMLKRKN